LIDARHTLAFSLGATHRYGERDLAVLALCAPWVIALLRQRLPYEGFDATRSALTEASAETATETLAPPDTPAYAARFEQVASSGGRASLTAREVEVAMLTLSGFSTRAIAEKLTISFETVRAHKKHIYTKLNVNSQSELFALFYEAGRQGA
jgi:DNA-binding CsgD family transcriptional regulator